MFHRIPALALDPPVRQFDVVTGTIVVLLVIGILIALFVFLLNAFEADQARRERKWSEFEFEWNTFAAILEKALNSPAQALIVVAAVIVAFAVYHFFFR